MTCQGSNVRDICVVAAPKRCLTRWRLAEADDHVRQVCGLLLVFIAFACISSVSVIRQIVSIVGGVIKEVDVVGKLKVVTRSGCWSWCGSWSLWWTAKDAKDWRWVADWHGGA